jgi:Domain of Unknown Function (DUF1080)
MKLVSALLIGAALSLATASAEVSTGHPFYGDPPDETHPWCVHDQNRPQPKLVKPLPASELEAKAKAPAGAIILFDGTEAAMSKWCSDKNPNEPTKWIVKDGNMECVPKSGYVRTKEEFSDCQLHVEWAAPTPPQGDSQGRGNSGIFLMGLVETQVLDNFDNPTYADGFACSMYGVSPPLANALRPPGEFQFIDITFHRPIYKDDKCVDPGWITVYCNGILMQDRQQIEGPTGHMRRPKPGAFPEKGPLKLQDHGNPVRFRNIWLCPLDPAKAGPPKHGPMTAKATAAKRKEIAAMVRKDAAKKPANSVEQMLRYAESLVYVKDDATCKKVEELAGQYLATLKQLPADQIASKKDEVLQVDKDFKYLAKWAIVPDDFGPKVEVGKLVKEHGWDKKPKK